MDFVGVASVGIVRVGYLNGYGISVSSVVPGHDDFVIIGIVIVVVVVVGRVRLVVRGGGVLLVGVEIQIPVVGSAPVVVPDAQYHRFGIRRKGYRNRVRIGWGDRVVSDSRYQGRTRFLDPQSRAVRDLVDVADDVVPSARGHAAAGLDGRQRSEGRRAVTHGEAESGDRDADSEPDAHPFGHVGRFFEQAAFQCGHGRLVKS